MKQTIVENKDGTRDINVFSAKHWFGSVSLIKVEFE